MALVERPFRIAPRERPAKFRASSAPVPARTWSAAGIRYRVAPDPQVTKPTVALEPENQWRPQNRPQRESLPGPGTILGPRPCKTMLNRILRDLGISSLLC